MIRLLLDQWFIMVDPPASWSPPNIPPFLVTITLPWATLSWNRCSPPLCPLSFSAFRCSFLLLLFIYFSLLLFLLFLVFLLLLHHHLHRHHHHLLLLVITIGSVSPFCMFCHSSSALPQALFWNRTPDMHTTHSSSCSLWFCFFFLSCSILLSLSLYLFSFHLQLPLSLVFIVSLLPFNPYQKSDTFLKPDPQHVDQAGKLLKENFDLCVSALKHDKLVFVWLPKLVPRWAHLLKISPSWSMLISSYVNPLRCSFLCYSSSFDEIGFWPSSSVECEYHAMMLRSDRRLISEVQYMPLFGSLLNCCPTL